MPVGKQIHDMLDASKSDLVLASLIAARHTPGAFLHPTNALAGLGRAAVRTMSTATERVAADTKTALSAFLVGTPTSGSLPDGYMALFQPGGGAPRPLATAEMRMYVSRNPHTLVWVNGIVTAPEAFDREAGALAAAEHAPVLGIYVQTVGGVGDLVRCVADDEYEPFGSNAASAVAQAILASNCRLRIVAHSRGTLVVEAALRALPRGQNLGGLDITLLGSPSPTLVKGPTYHDYEYMDDPVPPLGGGALDLARVGSGSVKAGGIASRISPGAGRQAGLAVGDVLGGAIEAVGGGPSQVGDLLGSEKVTRGEEARHPVILPHGRSFTKSIVTGGSLLGVLQEYASQPHDALDYVADLDNFEAEERSSGPVQSGRIWIQEIARVQERDARDVVERVTLLERRVERQGLGALTHDGQAAREMSRSVVRRANQVLVAAKHDTEFAGRVAKRGLGAVWHSTLDLGRGVAELYNSGNLDVAEREYASVKKRQGAATSSTDKLISALGLRFAKGVFEAMSFVKTVAGWASLACLALSAASAVAAAFTSGVSLVPAVLFAGASVGLGVISSAAGLVGAMANKMALDIKVSYNEISRSQAVKEYAANNTEALQGVLGLLTAGFPGEEGSLAGAAPLDVDKQVGSLKRLSLGLRAFGRLNFADLANARTAPMAFIGLVQTLLSMQAKAGELEKLLAKLPAGLSGALKLVGKLAHGTGGLIHRFASGAERLEHAAVNKLIISARRGEVAASHVWHGVADVWHGAAGLEHTVASRADHTEHAAVGLAQGVARGGESIIHHLWGGATHALHSVEEHAHEDAHRAGGLIAREEHAATHRIGGLGWAIEHWTGERAHTAGDWLSSLWPHARGSQRGHESAMKGRELEHAYQPALMDNLVGLFEQDGRHGAEVPMAHLPWSPGHIREFSHHSHHHTLAEHLRSELLHPEHEHLGVAQQRPGLQHPSAGHGVSPSNVSRMISVAEHHPAPLLVRALTSVRRLFAGKHDRHTGWFMQRSGDGLHPEVDPVAYRSRLLREGGVGIPMDAGLRTTLARNLGFDPTMARLHTGPAAAAAARHLKAEAFTIGHDVFFGAGQYEPGSSQGLSLIAHELTHVGQQTGAMGDRARFYSRSGGDEMEKEAQRTSERVLVNAGRAGGLQVEQYIRHYESDDEEGLTAEDQVRLDRISVMALKEVEQAVGNRVAGVIDDMQVDVNLDLETMTDAEAAKVWMDALMEAIGSRCIGESAMPLSRGTPSREDAEPPFAHDVVRQGYSELGALNIGPRAQAAAELFHRKHPDIPLTSGRRSITQQAHAIAANIIASRNRKWIERVYWASSARQKLQDWVNEHPEAKTAAVVGSSFEMTMRSMPAREFGHISKHRSGEAFDLQPQSRNARDLMAEIHGLQGVSKFLASEGGLARWHVEFKRNAGSAQQASPGWSSTLMNLVSSALISLHLATDPGQLQRMAASSTTSSTPVTDTAHTSVAPAVRAVTPAPLPVNTASGGLDKGVHFSCTSCSDALQEF